jgi:hypothetical protein
MSTIIEFRQDDQNQVSIRPKGYLGRDLFRVYQGAIDGARFDPNRRINVAPIDKVPNIIARLRQKGFGIDASPEIVEALKRFTAQQWLDLQAAKDRVSAIDEELRKLGEERGEKMSLYAFQRVGVEWLATRSGALLSDDMGLGKTLQTLAAIPAHAPILVVCPAVAKGVWRGEAQKWRPHLSAGVLAGRGSFRWPAPGEVLAVNYDILPNVHEAACSDKKCSGCAPFLKDVPENLVVVADEAHALKSAKAQRTTRFRAIARAARARGGRTWLLTATPLLNRPPELWSLLQAADLATEAFGSWNQFLNLFHARKKSFGGYEWGSPDSSVEERLRRVMLRRTKLDVLQDLPRKTYSFVDVEIDAKTLALCDEVLEVSKNKLEELLDENATNKNLFERWSGLRAALAAAKIPAMLDMVADYEEQEEPLVVFSAHRAPVDTLKKREGWEAITGDTSPTERTRIVEEFQLGRLRGVACTIDAGGVAITLTKACNVLFIDLKPTPGLNAQAEDRVCRIGQTRPVTITILVANHMLDDRISRIINKKQRLIDATVEAAKEDAPKTEVETVSPVETDLRARDEVVTTATAERHRHDAPKLRNPPRPPISAQEKWAAAGLRHLDDQNQDSATFINGCGFNKVDTGFGRSLRAQLEERGLTDTQWAMVIKVLKKYRRQIGECPKDEALEKEEST